MATVEEVGSVSLWVSRCLFKSLADCEVCSHARNVQGNVDCRLETLVGKDWVDDGVDVFSVPEDCDAQLRRFIEGIRSAEDDWRSSAVVVF